jgi:hypothetical protein
MGFGEWPQSVIDAFVTGAALAWRCHARTSEAVLFHASVVIKSQIIGRCANAGI